jgi:tRNA-splicing ligase RtcB
MKELRIRGDIHIQQVEPYVWQVTQQGDMRVPGRIYTDARGIKELADEVREGKAWNALKQVINVACLPGIQEASLAMADIHPGYGFPIGGVGAFDLETGVVSVAGVGYDINCGVRTLRTTLHRDEVEPHKHRLADALFRTVPAGLGSTGKLHLSIREMDKLLVEGARWVLHRGWGQPGDLESVENQGCIDGADPETVSVKAKERELRQIGSLGSGNHYLEVQWVEKIYDSQAADAYGLFPEQVVISIHSGSRALGHQIGSDYLKVLDAASRKYEIPIRERELVCAPYSSPEGQRYLAAVRCGINGAFANRQALAHLAREAFHQALQVHPAEITTLYEVGHNTAKVEDHRVSGGRKPLIVHRKGATRAFGPGHPDLPLTYREVGQPVLVGGTMGTASYVLAGTRKAEQDTFGSALHGAGRILSRKQATKQFRERTVVQELESRGTLVRAHSRRGVAEEAPGAYKDVDAVVEIMERAGIVRRIARVRPLICIKG